jgi:hypothetical protein
MLETKNKIEINALTPYNVVDCIIGGKDVKRENNEIKCIILNS